MAVQRLVLDSFADDDYELIAIHCSLASYRLAFLLNKNLNLRLFRKKEDIIFSHKDLIACFPLYQFEDHFQYTIYNLFGNKFQAQTEQKNNITNGLFTALAEDTLVTKYLIPELKSVDYFLKIETEASNFSSKSLLLNMLNISQIMTAYIVDHTILKSKNNLIFE